MPLSCISRHLFHDGIGRIFADWIFFLDCGCPLGRGWIFGSRGNFADAA